ncbi:hypothetical protein [Reichenbachiella versicolor]|uniref:hypothetical protein n=1 Tax=Reichenbachiella versicolor TaxID=1821036 RepID=UPI0013A55655|nr:hypothetical protein [Reichenbachiella versicolor]
MTLDKLNITFATILLFSVTYLLDLFLPKDEIKLTEQQTSFYSESGNQPSITKLDYGYGSHTTSYNSAQLKFGNNSMLMPLGRQAGKLRVELIKKGIDIKVSKIFRLVTSYKLSNIKYNSRDYIFINWSLFISLILMTIEKAFRPGGDILYWMSILAFALTSYIMFII